MVRVLVLAAALGAASAETTVYTVRTLANDKCDDARCPSIVIGEDEQPDSLSGYILNVWQPRIDLCRLFGGQPEGCEYTLSVTGQTRVSDPTCLNDSKGLLGISFADFVAMDEVSTDWLAKSSEDYDLSSCLSGDKATVTKKEAAVDLCVDEGTETVTFGLGTVKVPTGTYGFSATKIEGATCDAAVWVSANAKLTRTGAALQPAAATYALAVTQTSCDKTLCPDVPGLSTGTVDLPAGQTPDSYLPTWQAEVEKCRTLQVQDTDCVITLKATATSPIGSDGWCFHQAKPYVDVLGATLPLSKYSRDATWSVKSGTNAVNLEDFIDTTQATILKDAAGAADLCMSAGAETLTVKGGDITLGADAVGWSAVVLDEPVFPYPVTDLLIMATGSVEVPAGKDADVAVEYTWSVSKSGCEADPLCDINSSEIVITDPVAFKKQYDERIAPCMAKQSSRCFHKVTVKFSVPIGSPDSRVLCRTETAYGFQSGFDEDYEIANRVGTSPKNNFAECADTTKVKVYTHPVDQATLCDATGGTETIDMMTTLFKINFRAGATLPVIPGQTCNSDFKLDMQGVYRVEGTIRQPQTLTAVTSLTGMYCNTAVCPGMTFDTSESVDDLDAYMADWNAKVDECVSKVPFSCAFELTVTKTGSNKDADTCYGNGMMAVKAFVDGMVNSPFILVTSKIDPNTCFDFSKAILLKPEDEADCTARTGTDVVNARQTAIEVDDAAGFAVPTISADCQHAFEFSRSATYTREGQAPQVEYLAKTTASDACDLTFCNVVMPIDGRDRPIGVEPYMFLYTSWNPMIDACMAFQSSEDCEFTLETTVASQWRDTLWCVADNKAAFIAPFVGSVLGKEYALTPKGTWTIADGFNLGTCLDGSQAEIFYDSNTPACTAEGEAGTVTFKAGSAELPEGAVGFRAPLSKECTGARITAKATTSRRYEKPQTTTPEPWTSPSGAAPTLGVLSAVVLTAMAY